MRSRHALAAVLALTAGLSLAVATADAQTKRSGTVVAIDVDRRTLTLEEIGLAGQPERHLVTLDPSVRVVEVERRGATETEGPGAWPGGFREVPARYLAPGDFVTITFTDPGTPTARSIDVVRTEDAGTASASPPSGVELPPRR
jgi:hypothetical protein